MRWPARGFRLRGGVGAGGQNLGRLAPICSRPLGGLCESLELRICEQLEIQGFAPSCVWAVWRLTVLMVFQGI
eukprot:5029724-Pyramimonas_sp.AAC.1